jgi:hypothetical protein
MQTSYFAKYKGVNGISISLSSPYWFKGKRYRRLAPPWELLKKYKIDGDKEYYIKTYTEQVLSRLDAKQTYNDLGSNAVLLCWEKPEDFCHRHLVAKWFKNELGIEVPEYRDEMIIQMRLF